MLHFEKIESSILQGYIHEMYVKKPIYNNYYGVSLSTADYYKTEMTLIIRKSCEQFYRIYIMSFDKEDLISVLRQMPMDHVINIPTKTGINHWLDVLPESGYKEKAVYSRYYISQIEQREKFEECFAKESEFTDIKKLLYNHLSPITDRLPLDDELMDMIRNNWVFVNRNAENGKIEGVVGCTFERNTCYLPFWADLSGYGFLLMMNVFNLLAEKDIKYTYGWIRDGNDLSYGILQLLGMKPDGLKDYTFIKQ